MSDNQLLSVQTVADLLSVSRWTVYRLIWDGVLQSVQVGRCRRVVKSSLDAYLGGLIGEAA
ncbi:excisionase family DNA binding protein [Saccharothrix coeruleofusca]|uniref:helix-turn-helix domain-containing protein n=1 Tax=Saccharothrix coeruleofusca TaxID=33919 RepID=UPI001AE14384|nr:helix-turn-helix domain-containing protein [Saccharothrix coeruleofusca]MBP2340163.1 excisionase family DNA binding protein [Saccharothrix coeruleofusca]